MTSFGIALVIFLGTMIGLYFSYPNANAYGLLAGGGINALIFYGVIKLATYALPLLRKQ